MGRELTAVKTELDRINQGKDKETMLALFKSLIKDVSEPTTTLVAKLNCETKRELGGGQLGEGIALRLLLIMANKFSGEASKSLN